MRDQPEIETGTDSGYCERLPGEALVRENIDLLRQGIAIVSSLPDGCYERNAHALFADGIGRHFRHVLDVYERLLDRVGIVDYDARRRDPRVEQDRDHAIDAAERMIAKLPGLALGPSYSDGMAVSERLAVRVEVKGDSGSGIVTSSSVARELAAVATHTIHHYAIIGLLMKIQNVEPPADFGIAPSTLRHRKSMSSNGGTYAASGRTFMERPG